LLGPVERFLAIQTASGILLLLAATLALAWANSPWKGSYTALWETPIGVRLGTLAFERSLGWWINDGLMVIFFFVVGLEIRREIHAGELSDLRRAALPLAAALGGMVAPALIYAGFNRGLSTLDGWGIPMATDIAFVVGCMAVLGKRIPVGLRVLLLTLAIADDIGAILVIAIGYSDGVNTTMLGLGAAGIALVALLARLGVRSFGVYTLVGAGIWWCFHASGVHATIAGVILGLQTPARSNLDQTALGRFLQRPEAVQVAGVGSVQRVMQLARESVSPLDYLMHALHAWVGFAILPIFALANAGVKLDASALTHPLAISVGAGLLLGKPIGIVAVSWIAVKVRLSSLPPGVTWTVLGGAGFLAGIGFTMAIFIASLALEGALLDTAKVGILAGSALAAAIGMGLLYQLLPAPPLGAQAQRT
jgi:NhaA family Na+:H+ antiporter